MNDARCLRVHKINSGTEARLESTEPSALNEGEVLIRARYSSVNYKDALAVTGRAPILKTYPLVPGIDVAGVIEASRSPQWKEGDKVLITGCGLGESHDGGYAERLQVPAGWLIGLPSGMSLKDSMILGTAGFTAALAVDRMEQNGQKPEMGPVVVTGASGGVGNFAIQILSQKGYEVIAVSGRAQFSAELKALGASQVMNLEQLGLGERPLEKARFGGAVDNVGGSTLAGLSRHVDLWGNIACIGLAAGADLNMTVMPMILRGVSLLGVSSTNCPMPWRKRLWNLLAGNWKPRQIEQIHQRTIDFDSIIETSESLLDRKLHGRTLVDFHLKNTIKIFN